MDLFRSGTLAALLLILPAATGCQALFGRARVETPEEAAISKSVKTRLAAEKTVPLTNVEVETNSCTVYLSGTVPSLAAAYRAFFSCNGLICQHELARGRRIANFQV